MRSVAKRLLEYISVTYMRDEGIVERVAELKAQVPAKADILSAFEHISYENS
jgi:hypothetical protein